MKRILGLLLCVCIAVSLTGCTTEAEKQLLSYTELAWKAAGRPTAINGVYHCQFDSVGIVKMIENAKSAAEIMGSDEYFENEDEYSLSYGFDIDKPIHDGEIFCFICDQGNIYVLMKAGIVLATANQPEMFDLASQYSDLFPPEVYNLSSSEERRALLQSNLDKAKVLYKRIAILSGASMGLLQSEVATTAELNEWHGLPDQWIQKLSQN